MRQEENVLTVIAREIGKTELERPILVLFSVSFAVIAVFGSVTNLI